MTLAMALAAIVAPVMAQTANTKTTTTYDALDRVTQVTDPSGLNTTYQYDGLSNPTSTTSPDTGVTARTFDAAGNVLTGTDAKGITVTYTYDAQDRKLSASYADTTQNIAYQYDEPNSTTGCSTSYPIGHLTRIVEASVTTVYCYNAQGDVIQKQQVTASGTDTTGYGYTAANRLSGIVYPSGSQASYARDGDGRIQSINVTPPGGTASTAVSQVTYQPFGPVSGYTLGNGQAIARTYDANYRLTDLVSPAFTLHVARDVMGDISAIGNAAGANPATETYSYDPLYRLTTVTEANGTVLEGVTYNQTGDRLTKTGSGLDTGSYGYNPNTHQLVSVGNSALTVDANGNTTGMTQAGSTYGFGYSARNRMTVAQLAGNTVGSYLYNSLNERIQKVANGATERYDYNEGSQILGEYGATNRDYVWLDNLPIANIDNSSTTSSIAYVTADQLGTPRAIANSSGTTEWQNAYQGNPWNEQAPTSVGYIYNLGFPGQYFDAETGLSNNVNRDYDSSTGRYIESDPLGLLAGSSTYAYAGGAPLSYADSLGLFPQTAPAPAPSPSPSPAPGTGQVPDYGPPANDPDIDPDLPEIGLCAANPILCGAALFLYPNTAGGPDDETMPPGWGSSNVIPFPGGNSGASPSPGPQKDCPNNTGCESEQLRLMMLHFQKLQLLMIIKGTDVIAERAIAQEFNKQAIDHNKRCPGYPVDLLPLPSGPRG